MKCTRISVKKTTIGFGLLMMASTTSATEAKSSPERSRRQNKQMRELFLLLIKYKNHELSILN
ncbi:hypothetical protein EZS27_001953 [termite gut metagenome]|uniref:Uncharacterized protein n=1 Tax=termite gut metagenome TaxID=433724 RepID=A0A5J4T042_9ZZZZ